MELVYYKFQHQMHMVTVEMKRHCSVPICKLKSDFRMLVGVDLPIEQLGYATGLDKEDENPKVSPLLYCLGVEGDDILTSTGVTADDCDQNLKYTQQIILGL